MPKAPAPPQVPPLVISGDRIVIGIDPGPYTGIAILRYGVTLVASAAPELIQCTANSVLRIVAGVIGDAVTVPIKEPTTVLLCYEHWTNGPRAARTNSPEAGATTVRLCNQLDAMRDRRIIVTHYSAAQIKEWGTDMRLQAANLYRATTGMGHTRDACRVALFGGKHDFGLPDPLSRKAPNAHLIAALQPAGQPKRRPVDHYTMRSV